MRSEFSPLVDEPAAVYLTEHGVGRQLGLSNTAEICHHPLLDPPAGMMGPLVVITSAPTLPKCASEIWK